MLVSVLSLLLVHYQHVQPRYVRKYDVNFCDDTSWSRLLFVVSDSYVHSAFQHVSVGEAIPGPQAYFEMDTMQYKPATINNIMLPEGSDSA